MYQLPKYIIHDKKNKKPIKTTFKPIKTMYLAEKTN